MMVFVGRLRTRLKVSRILDVVIWSFEVLFQMDRMSSCQEEDTAEAEDRGRSSTVSTLPVLSRTAEVLTPRWTKMQHLSCRNDAAVSF